jgi:hypothetical protein
MRGDELDKGSDAPPPNQRLRLNPDVISKRLDQATVLVDISTSRIFELNEIATRVWELVGQGLGADGIVRHLLDEYDVEHARAADEVSSLLERLRVESLLVL